MEQIFRVDAHLVKLRAKRDKVRVEHEKLGRELEDLESQVTQMENDDMLRQLRERNILPEDLWQILAERQSEKPQEEIEEW